MTFSPTQREELRKLAEGADTFLNAQPSTNITLPAHWQPWGDYSIAMSPSVAIALLDALDAAEGALLSASRDHAPTTCSALEWRDLTDLPPEGDCVLTSSLGYVCTGTREHGEFFNVTGDRLVQVDHWVPMPLGATDSLGVKYGSSASTGVAAQVVGDKSREKLESRLTAAEGFARGWHEAVDAICVIACVGGGLGASEAVEAVRARFDGIIGELQNVRDDCDNLLIQADLAAESRLTTLEEALREIEANSLSASSRRIARSALAGEPG